MPDQSPLAISHAPLATTHVRQLPPCYSISSAPTLATCKALWFSIGTDDVYFRLDDVRDDWWTGWKVETWKQFEYLLHDTAARAATIAALCVLFRYFGKRVFNLCLNSRKDFRRIVILHSPRIQTSLLLLTMFVVVVRLYATWSQLFRGSQDNRTSAYRESFL
jgi:hypothetical protein